MQLVLGCDDIVAKWAGEKLKIKILPPYSCIGWTRDGQSLCAAAVFNGFNGSNIDVTIYGPGCLTKGTIRAVFHYVFEQLKVNRITAMTARSNKRLQKILPRLGFKWEGISPMYYGPERRNDAIIYGLSKERAQKWLVRN